MNKEIIDNNKKRGDILGTTILVMIAIEMFLSIVFAFIFTNSQPPLFINLRDVYNLIIAVLIVYGIIKHRDNKIIKTIVWGFAIIVIWVRILIILVLYMNLTHFM